MTNHEPSTQGIDLLLIFPPLDVRFRFPELGLPRLTAHLRGRGWSVAQLDLNADFIQHQLYGDESFEAVQRRIRRRLPGLPGYLQQLPPEQFLQREIIHHHSVNRHAALYLAFMEAYNKLVGVGGFCGDIRSIAAAARDDELFTRHFEPCLEAMEQTDPCLVGFSMVSPAQVGPALLYARLIKQRWPHRRVVWGGPWCTATTDSFAGFDQIFSHVDYLVSLQGELPLDRLLAFLRGQGSLEQVPNLRRWHNGRVTTSAAGPALPLDQLRQADYDGMLVANRLPVLIASGCYWGRCRFCSHLFPQAGYHKRSPAGVARELRQLQHQYGVDDFDLSCHSAPERLLGSIAGQILTRKLELTWSAMIRADGPLAPDYFATLYRSGCRELLFGLETANQQRLDQLGKGISLDHLRRCIQNAAAAGIRAKVFILHYHDQPAAEYQSTLGYLQALGPQLAGFIPQRYQQGRHMPRPPGLQLEPGAPFHVNSFALPWVRQGGLSEQQFFSMTHDRHQQLH